MIFKNNAKSTFIYPVIYLLFTIHLNSKFGCNLLPKIKKASLDEQLCKGQRCIKNASLKKKVSTQIVNMQKY